MSPGSNTESYPAFAHIGLRENPRKNLNQIVVITEDVHLLFEYRPHIDVSLTCEHDPKLQEYCVCPQNMPQFDSEGIPNQAPETNKPMILNGPTSINREGSDQVSVEAKQLGHLYLSIDQETFDPSTPTRLHNIECNLRLGMNCQSALLMACSTYGECTNAYYRVLVGRPEGKRPLERPRFMWEDNIKMDLREMGYDDRDWINLAQDRDAQDVRATMNLRVP
ncbi:hypothetical protein ANN_10780 [Periplaneta americana]|uniref:Uncharacterized protein n=1 Tax=Periplaneta americana TaxID=6978 RepID=A0ABQ8T4E1_PERAM|nr:hypothetical protein ANN_10780 [Periplaneta americana]